MDYETQREIYELKKRVVSLENPLNIEVVPPLMIDQDASGRKIVWLSESDPTISNPVTYIRIIDRDEVTNPTGTTDTIPVYYYCQVVPTSIPDTSVIEAGQPIPLWQDVQGTFHSGPIREVTDNFEVPIDGSAIVQLINLDSNVVFEWEAESEVHYQITGNVHDNIYTGIPILWRGTSWVVSPNTTVNSLLYESNVNTGVPNGTAVRAVRGDCPGYPYVTVTREADVSGSGVWLLEFDTTKGDTHFQFTFNGAILSGSFLGSRLFTDAALIATALQEALPGYTFTAVGISNTGTVSCQITGYPSVPYELSTLASLPVPSQIWVFDVKKDTPLIIGSGVTVLVPPVQCIDGVITTVEKTLSLQYADGVLSLVLT